MKTRRLTFSINVLKSVERAKDLSLTKKEKIALWRARKVLEGVKNLICPKCGSIRESHFDSNVMGEFEWLECTNLKCRNVVMVSSDMPSWMRQEERELTQRHRVLPSGDVEFADEYGGY